MMKKNKTILYIGNNLTQKTKYSTTIILLSKLLEEEGFSIIIKSNMINKILRLLDMITSVVKFRKSINFILIDTYSTTNFYYAFIVSQFARMFKIKYIPILHGGNLPSRIIKSKFLSKLIFKNSYKNIAPSNFLKFAFEKEGYKAEYIPNTVNVKEYTLKNRKKIQPKILWVRAFKQIYNPTLAIKVLCILKRKYPKAILCMIGPFSDDSYKETLELVREYQLEDAVEFTDVLSKEDWHKKSQDFDIFINTTNIDNTPVSVIEAMALGLTLVSTNVGGIPYLIDDKKEGVLVDKNNANQMSEAIIGIIENNNSELAINARKKAESFDWSIVRNKWLEILN